jgi:hypothetical protein
MHLKQYNKRHGLKRIKTQGRIIKPHPPSLASSWLSTIPMPISTTQSIQPSPSPTIECHQLICQMSLPPLLRRPRLVSPSHSTPSPTPPTSHPLPPTTSQCRRKLRSTSSQPNLTSTRRSAPSPTGSFRPSTAEKSSMCLKLRSTMRQTESYKRGSSNMRTRSTATSSSPAAPTVTNQTRDGSPLRSRSAKRISPTPNLSSSETMVEPSYWRGRSITKSRTPLTSSSHLTTHPLTSPSQSLFGSTPSSMDPLPHTTLSVVPLLTSTTGTQLQKSSDTDAPTTNSDTSMMSSPSFKPRFILLKTTSRYAITALRPPASCPAFRIWKDGHGPKIIPLGGAPLGKEFVRDQEVQARMGGDDIVVYPRFCVIRTHCTNWA